SLSALLMMVAYRMSHWEQFVRTLHIAPRSDTIVLVACFGFTVFVDMVAGVTVGVVLACFLLMQRVAQLTHAQVSHNASGHHRKLRHLSLPDDVMVYHINGLVFFGTVESALESVGFVHDAIKTLIIDMEDVPLIDMTGLVAMKNMILDVQGKNRAVILCGAPEITDNILLKLPVGAKYPLKVARSVAQAIEMVTTQA
ncbi:MAG: STAS domain-containing protein, partial [Rickettsiales bacterium]|nr:STAS domain-containing protein [Rickettsiales bacterium]